MSKRCILCGGALGDVLYEGIRDRLGLLEGTWRFLRCRDCGSGVLDPMPSERELLAAYPEVYAVDQAPLSHPMHRLWHGIETRWFYGPMYRASVRKVMRRTGLRGGRMLDVGGGTGRRTAFFQKAGFEAWVLEPDERPLRIAQERFGLRVIHGTVEEISEASEHFDLITFFAVLEHLPDPQRALQAAVRLLRPNGWVAALVPVLDRGQARLLGARWHEVREAPRHVFLPTVKGMCALFGRSGLIFQSWEGESAIHRAGIMASRWSSPPSLTLRVHHLRSSDA